MVLDAGMSGRSRPGVSVVMPVLDEGPHLAEAVDAILSSEYDGPLEVVLALGPSRDDTDDVARALAAADARVLLVSNPSGRTASGLNAAIATASYDVIARVDGHAIIPPDYLAVAVRTLDETDADNVGGVMGAEGVTEFEQAVAAAMRSWFGVGGAAFHIGGQPGPALTVYLGCFRRSALERCGGYDESMVRAQDWELNHRIRSSGGTVWFTPDLHVTYRPRPSLGALARQYFEYGRWRREVAQRYPETISPRYLAPPITLIGVVAGTALGLAGVAARRPAIAALGFAAPAAYATATAIATAKAARVLPWRVARHLPAVFATMHSSWGAGFLLGAR